ncbi:MAG: four helix bundle protein [Bacteroidetes bacterium 43-16]|nr:MAG: four helix bundle protein [Bacteroidetes bacterium 43-16]
MKQDNIIQYKSFAFAVRIVNIFKYLQEEMHEFILSKQLLRCGTSIGANVEEAIGGQCERDFYAKLTIANKEAREARYWINLLFATDYFNKKEAESLLKRLKKSAKLLVQFKKQLKPKKIIKLF